MRKGVMEQWCSFTGERGEREREGGELEGTEMSLPRHTTSDPLSPS